MARSDYILHFPKEKTADVSELLKEAVSEGTTAEVEFDGEMIAVTLYSCDFGNVVQELDELGISHKKLEETAPDLKRVSVSLHALTTELVSAGARLHSVSLVSRLPVTPFGSKRRATPARTYSRTPRTSPADS